MALSVAVIAAHVAFLRLNHLFLLDTRHDLAVRLRLAGLCASSAFHK